jgi:hypothetical protein
MKFLMIFSQFLKAFCLERMLPGCLTKRCKFLDRKGRLEQMENYNVIRIFGSKENPFFLLCHVSDKMFVTKIARQYNYWLHFFHEKRKKQFIPLPWKVGDFIFRNMNKIDEFAGHFHSLNLTYAERVKGFDPSGIFVEHLLSIGFNNFFINAILNEDGDNDSGTPVTWKPYSAPMSHTNRKEKVRVIRVPNPQLSLQRVQHLGASAPTAHQIKKVTHNSSGRGGDNNPPGKIESSHKLPLRKKEKTLCKKRRDLEVKEISVTSPSRIWNSRLTSKSVPQH